MVSQISIAILGAGIFARIAHVPGLKTLGDLVSIKAVYSKSEKSAKDLAAQIKTDLHADVKVYHDADPQNSLDNLLASDIDAVIVILPITIQPKIILKALAAGKHVLSEKPVAPDVKSGLELIKEYNSVYKPKGLVWRVAENYEADFGFQAAGKAIRDGKIGKVTNFSATLENYITQDSEWYKTSWRTVPDYQGGFLLDGGVHSAAALRVMLPEPLKYLSGFASLNVDWLAPLDTITTTIQTVNGIHGTFFMTFSLPAESLKGNVYEITGTKGRITATTLPGAKVAVKFTNTKDEVETTEYDDKGVPNELASFFKVVGGGDDDGLGDPYNALKDVALLQASFDSHGERVDLEELTKQT